MNNYTFYNYTEIIFGKGVQEQTGALVKRFGKKVLLHYGGGSIKRSGLYGEIIDSLRQAQVDFVELGGVQPNPRLGLAQKGIQLCRKENIDFILAVGGGSVIDSAKCIASGVHYRGDVWDFFEGKECTNEILPIGVILTIPAAGSESSDSLVITKEEGLLKWSFSHRNLRPRFAVMNPELTYTLPAYQTACGVSDMLAHIMERYFTRVGNVDVTDRMCEAVMRSILYNAPQLLTNPKNYAARAEIMQAGTIAHNDILTMGRIGDWASHGIEHELSAIYDIAHGAGLSVIFPAWMKYVYHTDMPRFVQFAVRVMDVDLDFAHPEEIILEGIHRLEVFYHTMGLPTRLSELNIDETNFALMARKAAPLGSYVNLQEKDIYQIYQLAK